MKQLLVFAIIFLSCDITIKADTIDYCNIYYNNTLINDLGIYRNDTLFLKVKDIRSTDSLKIIYHRDAPCPDCPAKVEIREQNGRVAACNTAIGTATPIKIALRDLILKSYRYTLSMYYYEEYGNRDAKPFVILFLKLE